MNPLLPTSAHVRTAMETELRESQALGRRATVSTVEKQVGVSHATFYRNYPDQIVWFKAQLDAQRETRTSPKVTAKREDDLARLRGENTDLRKLVKIYAEAIRQLTLAEAALEDELQALAGVARLDERRRQRGGRPEYGRNGPPDRLTDGQG
ncbi:hypothetical protein [Umezawaea sp. Da 62-37]|uniref:hypothetical protein n=1 Tax=Umezawaea sp. Da 62-37 TaxID=3075927 RepID=UPI0028F6E362|nr:hypothetical protein [Umezawaea sp. Da 62-37]WNV83101.1 hypothetical protein RM788_33595 [Umezawaea sp. Da 62-37]